MFQHKTKLSISIDTKSNIYDYTRTLKFRDIGLQFSKYGLPLLLDSTDIIGNYSIMTKREFWSWNNFHNRQVGNLAYSKSREIPAVLSNIRIEKEGEDVRYCLLGDIGYDRKKESCFNAQIHSWSYPIEVKICFIFGSDRSTQERTKESKRLEGIQMEEEEPCSSGHINTFETK